MSPDQDDTDKWPSGNSATRRRKRRKDLTKKAQPKGKAARYLPAAGLEGNSASPSSPETYLEAEGI